jgi:ribose transport system permease protein
MSTSPQIETSEEELIETGLSVSERYRGLWVGLGLIAVVIAFTSILPGFRFVGVSNLTNLALDSTQILIMAVAMTFVMIAAGLDLSVGSVLVLSSVVTAIVMAEFSGTAEEIRAFEYPQAHIGIPVGIIAGLATGTATGFINGLLITQLRLPPFIVTLGMMGIALGAALVITNGVNTPYVPDSLQRAFGAARIWGLIPLPVIVAVVVTAIGWIVLSRTKFGVYTYAIGANPDGARRAGINVDRHLLWIYSANGLCAAIAGVVEVSRFATTAINSHLTDNLQAITAVVLGGTSLFGGIGSMGGTVIGALFPSILQNGFIQVGIQPFWQQIILGIVLITTIAVDANRRAKY